MNYSTSLRRMVEIWRSTKARRAMPKNQNDIWLQCKDTLSLIKVSRSLVFSSSDSLKFYHLIPLAQRHILYTPTCSVCRHWSHVMSVQRKVTHDGFLFSFFLTVTVIFCQSDALMVFFLMSPLITKLFWGFCSEYTTVTDYHFHYSVLYVLVFEFIFQAVYLSVDKQWNITALCVAVLFCAVCVQWCRALHYTPSGKV